MATFLLQHVLPPLERQQLTVRPGFEPQACQVPTQRGSYLFGKVDDVVQVRGSSASAVSCSCRGLSCVCLLLLLLTRAHSDSWLCMC